MSTLIECLQEKEFEPERMLIISVEETREKGEYFWNSIPVKSTLPKNVILHRIILDENTEEYELFSQKYDVVPSFSLYVFGSNSTIISKRWTQSFPDPAEFATYISSTQVGAFEFDDQHDPDQQEENFEDDLNDENHRTKKVKISIRTDEGMQSKYFRETDIIQDVNLWLASLCGSGHSYVIVHNNQPFPRDFSLTLRDAGLSPSALLRIDDSLPQDTNNAPRRARGNVERNERGCFGSEGDSESFWEYQPSNNPDIAQVVVRNVTG